MRILAIMPSPLQWVALPLVLVLQCLCITTKAQAPSYNYAELTQKALFFFEGQRSGKLPPYGHGPENNRVWWRGDAHMKDGEEAGVDLTGGWYDAGDAVKWNLSIAHSVLTMAISGIEYREGYLKSGQMPFLISNIKWATDYLMKCFKYRDINDPATYTIFTEVGTNTTYSPQYSSREMHEVIYRMIYGMRNVGYADRFAPNADVVSAMAAALGYASVFFRENGQPAYADDLMLVAEKLELYAATYPKPASIRTGEGQIAPPIGYPDPNPFALNDNLCIAALAVHRAKLAKDPSYSNRHYIDRAIALANSFAEWFDSPRGDHYYTLNVYNPLCYVELLKLLPTSETTQYRTKLQRRLIEMASPNHTPAMIDPSPALGNRSSSSAVAQVGGGPVLAQTFSVSGYPQTAYRNTTAAGAKLTTGSDDPYNPNFTSHGGGLPRISDGYFPLGAQHMHTFIVFLYADWLKKNPALNPLSVDFLSGSEIEISNADGTNTPVSGALNPLTIPAPGNTLADKLISWGKRILDFTCGSNPDNRSYVVGFQPPGKDVVRAFHHQSANSFWSINTVADTRNVNYGTLVSPSSIPFHPADKGFFRHIEPVIYANSALLANAARMVAQDEYNANAPGFAPIPQEQFPPDPIFVERNNVTTLTFQDIRAEYETTRNLAYGRTSPALNNNNTFNWTGNPTDLEFFAEAAVNTNAANSFRLEVNVNNRSRWPARVTNNLSVRYYFRLADNEVNPENLRVTLVDGNILGYAVAMGLSANPENPLQPKPVRRSANSNEYYVEFGFPNTPIFPGGAGGFFGNQGEQWSYIRRAVLLFEWTGGTAINAGPNRSNLWDHTNDPSFGESDPAFQISPTGTTSTLISSSADGDWRRLRVDFIAKKIPIYNNGQKLWGDAPWEAETPANAFIQATPLTHRVSAAAGTISIQINANTPYNIYSDAEWIVAQETAGEGNMTVNLVYLPNNEKLARSGEVIITNGTITQKILIEQEVNPSKVPDLSGPVTGCVNPPCTTGPQSDNPCDDNTPPVLISMTPGNGSTNVSTETEIELVFSEPVFPIHLGSSGSIFIRRLRDNGIEGGRNGNTGYSVATNYAAFVTGLGTNTIKIRPAARLSFDTEFYVEIQPNTFQDAAGNKFEGINGLTDREFPAHNKWRFSTIALTASPCNRGTGTSFRFFAGCPEMSVSPANGATNVALDANLVFNVGREVVLSGGLFKLYRADNNALVDVFGPDDVASGKLQIQTVNGSSIITMNPDQDLLPNMEYYVLIDGTTLTGTYPKAAMTDIRGIKFDGIKVASGSDAWRFTTAASSWSRKAVAANALKIQSIVLLDANGNNPIPFNNGDVVPASHLNGRIQFTFNRPIRRFTADDRNASPVCNFGGDIVFLKRLSDGSEKGRAQWNQSEVKPYASWNFTPPFDCPQPENCNPTNPRGCPTAANAVTNAPTNVLTVEFRGTLGALSTADNAYFLEMGPNAFIDVTTAGTFSNIFMEGSNIPVSFGVNGFIIRTTPPSNTGPTPPVVNTYSPANNSTGVANITNLTLTFNKGVRRVPGTNGNITIRRNSDNAVIAVIPVSHPDISVNNTTVTIPNSLFGNLSNSSTVASSYHVLIDANSFESFDGALYAGISASNVWSFTTTPDNTAPVIASNAREPNYVPANNLTGVGLQPTLITTFAEPIQKGTGNITLRLFSNNQVVATIPVNNAAVEIRNSRLGPNTQVVINGSNLPELLPNTRYYVTIDAGAFRDRSNNNFAGFTSNSVWSFTTVAILPKLISYTTPPSGPYSFTFDAPVGLVTNGTSVFAIYRKSDNSLFEEFRPYSPKVVVSGNTVTLNNENQFEPGETYYVNIGSNLVFNAAAGNAVRFLGWSGACMAVAAIPKLNQEIVFEPIGDKTYGDAAFTINATATSGLPVQLTLVGGPVTLEGNVVTIKGTGTVTIKASQPGNKQYEPAEEVVRTFVIHKKQLIVRADDKERFYLEPNPVLTFTYDGFVYGEDETVLDEQPQPVTIATTQSDAGEYVISFSGGQDNNYTFDFRNGKLTIKPASQTIHFTPLADVVYQSNPLLSFALQATATSGLPVSYTVSGPAQISNDNIITINGIGPVTVVASQDGNDNYAAATPVSVTFNVTTTDKLKGVKPILRCVLDNRDGTYTAIFGYKNDMGMPVFIPLGSANYTVPGNLSGVVTHFLIGNVYEAFRVRFAANSNVSWSLAGPDGKLRTATATANAEICEQSIERTLVLKATPNPTTGIVTIQVFNPNAQQLFLQVLSFQGQQIQSMYLGKLQFQALQLDLSSYPNGLYTIVVTSPNDRGTLKLIKN